jgi:hypothetical protein
MRFVSLISAALFLASMSGYKVSAQNVYDGYGHQEFRDAVRLYDNAMFDRSRSLFDEISKGSDSADPEGFSVLGQVRSALPGYEAAMDSFCERNPHSVHVPQIRLHHAMNLFDRHDYKSAGEVLESIDVDRLHKSQRTDYLFRKAYCDLENRNLESAKSNFSLVESSHVSDYAAP